MLTTDAPNYLYVCQFSQRELLQIPQQNYNAIYCAQVQVVLSLKKYSY